MMARNPRAPSNILDNVQTRKELRDYLDEQLPGWTCWLDAALAVLDTRDRDELQLVTRVELMARLEALAEEMYKELGQLGEVIGREYAQKSPYYDLSEQRAWEPYARWQGEGPDLGIVWASVERDPMPITCTMKGTRPFSHLQLGGRVASRDVIGNLLGLAHLKTLNPQRRGGLGIRRFWAVHMVATELAPCLRKACSKTRPLLPDRYLDPAFDPANARQGPVSKALAVVLAVYLGLPGRASPQFDPKRLHLPLNIAKKTTSALTRALRAPDPDVWRIRQGPLDTAR